MVATGEGRGWSMDFGEVAGEVKGRVMNEDEGGEGLAH